MFDEWGQLLLAAATFAVLASFGGGTIWNMRKGEAAIKWLRDGLPMIGERSTMRWIGTAGVTLSIAKAKNAFRSAEILILLEPRDVFFLWAFFRARGRRDLLIFRAHLRTAPAFDLEAVNPQTWSGRAAAHHATERGWARLPLNSTQSLTTYHAGTADPPTAQALLRLAEKIPGKLARLAVHRSTPNLELHWQLPDAKTQSARDWFSQVQRLGEALQTADR